MNKNIDLTEILEDCPKGFELYSSIYGTVTFAGIDYNDSKYPICVKTPTLTLTFTKKGRYFCSCSDSECCLFPSREQRDWSKFTAPWYKKEKASLQTNEREWLYLVSDVLTWKDGIGQYLDDPRVQELAKRLCGEYAQKLYNSSVLSNSSSTIKNEQKSTKTDFSEALKLLKQGKTLRRDSWSGNKRIMLAHYDCLLPFISIVTKDGSIGVYTSTNCDILADDWVEI